MMIDRDDPFEPVLFARGVFWIERFPGAGYVIYSTGRRCVARCGYPGQRGLEWCKDEIGRRVSKMTNGRI